MHGIMRGRTKLSTQVKFQKTEKALKQAMKRAGMEFTMPAATRNAAGTHTRLALCALYEAGWQKCHVDCMQWLPAASQCKPGTIIVRPVYVSQHAMSGIAKFHVH